MKKIIISILSLALLAGCETKPKSIVITQQNVVEVLTQYGKENPENEVLIETKHGNIRLKLFEDTPLHRANFVKLIKEGFYDDDANFYRIVYEFMIQGGDLKQNLTYRIPAEFHQKYFHRKGALSMARVSENNPEMQSSASDFFIVHGGRYTEEDVEIDAKNLGLNLTPEQKRAYINGGGYMELDQKYTVFGEVLEGNEVVDKIASEKVFDVDKPLKEIPFKISLIARK
jgi:cyclophilin family peptidyl-prolyl cis-trans isomerase